MYTFRFFPLLVSGFGSVSLQLFFCVDSLAFSTSLCRPPSSLGLPLLCLVGGSPCVVCVGVCFGAFVLWGSLRAGKPTASSELKKERLLIFGIHPEGRQQAANIVRRMIGLYPHYGPHHYPPGAGPIPGGGLPPPGGRDLLRRGIGVYHHPFLGGDARGPLTTPSFFARGGGRGGGGPDDLVSAVRRGFFVPPPFVDQGGAPFSPSIYSPPTGSRGSYPPLTFLPPPSRHSSRRLTPGGPATPLPGGGSSGAPIGIITPHIGGRMSTSSRAGGYHHIPPLAYPTPSSASVSHQDLPPVYSSRSGTGGGVGGLSSMSSGGGGGLSSSGSGGRSSWNRKSPPSYRGRGDTELSPRGGGGGRESPGRYSSSLRSGPYHHHSHHVSGGGGG
ncbi:hypothetical protein CSUI_005177, partial [Cystoisospora suis]